MSVLRGAMTKREFLRMDATMHACAKGYRWNPANWIAYEMYQQGFKDGWSAARKPPKKRRSK